MILLHRDYLGHSFLHKDNLYSTIHLQNLQSLPKPSFERMVLNLIEATQLSVTTACANTIGVILLAQLNAKRACEVKLY